MTTRVWVVGMLTVAAASHGVPARPDFGRNGSAPAAEPDPRSPKGFALAALDDKEWYTRVMADYALRGLANDAAGVGYDPAKPDAKLWREFWAENKK
ncbi:MAG TPA: hypothetical protein VMZ71_10060 [Gemmataceae bacterium]|nr:hypothetical protein [Gemmataceae bacterium]